MSKNNLNAFRNALINNIYEQLNLNRKIATGEITAKLGNKLGYTMTTTEWLGTTIDTGVAITASKLIAEHLGMAADIIPIVGPSITAILKIASAIIKNRVEHSRKENAKLNDEVLYKFIHGKIRLSIEEVVHEVARIYEYQINILKNSKQVEKAAKYAADKMIKYAINYYKESQNDPTVIQLRELLLEGLIKLSEDKGEELETLIDDELNNQGLKSWHVDSMFTKPGLRAEYDNSNDPGKLAYKFLIQKDTPKRNTQKYGYRSRIMALESEYSYKEHISDERQNYCIDYGSSILHLKHKTTQTLYRIVDEYEIRCYLQDLNTMGDKVISFNEYIQQLYKQPSPIIAACRDRILSRNFDKGNFNNVDFMRANLIGTTWKNTQLKNAFLLFANLQGAHFKNATLLEANLSGATLENADLHGDNILTKSKLYYISINSDTDFSNNITLNGAKMEGFPLNETTTNMTIASDIEQTQSNLKVVQKDVKKLHKEMQKITESSKLKRKRNTLKIITNLDDVVELYELQNNEFDKLEQALKKHTEVAITGLPGAGKTQLSTYYANWFVRKHQAEGKKHILAWKIQADTDENLLRDLKALALKLGADKIKVNKEVKLDAIVSTVKEYLESYKFPYLLIIDNMKDQNSLVISKLRNIGQGKIIVTSYNTDFFVDHDKCVELKGFNPEHAATFLLKGRIEVSDADRAEALKLAEELSYLPLGLLAARLFMREEISISKYRKLLQDPNEAVEIEKKQVDLIGPYGKTLFIAIKTLVELTSSQNAMAKSILESCAFLGFNNIPLFFVQGCINTENGKEGSKIQALNIVRSLEKLSLVHLHGKDDDIFISMHKVVQDVVIKMMTLQDKQLKLQSTMKLCTKYFVKNTQLALATKRNNLLLPHIESILSHAEAFDNNDILFMKAWLLNIKAYFYTQIGTNLLEAFNISKKAKLICEDLGKIKDTDNTPALLLYTKLTETRINDLPVLYASILYTYGRMYFYTEIPEHKEDSRKNLDMCIELSKVIKKDNLRISYEIFAERTGTLFHYLRENTKTSLDKATERYKELLNEQGSYIDETGKIYDLANDTFHKMMCCRQLIKTYQQLAKLEGINDAEKVSHYNQALEYAGKLIEIAQTDKEEQEVLASHYNSYANLYVDKDNPERNFEKAEKYFKLSIDIETKKNDGKGKINYPLADAYRGMALIYIEKQDLQRALENSRNCLKIRLEMHKGQENHPQLIAARSLVSDVCYKLAEIYLPDNQKLIEAIDLIKECINIRSAIYPPEHLLIQQATEVQNQLIALSIPSVDKESHVEKLKKPKGENTADLQHN